VRLELVDELVHPVEVDAGLDAEAVRLDLEPRRAWRCARESQTASKGLVDKTPLNC
jgi:hypothetical protein